MNSPNDPTKADEEKMGADPTDGNVNRTKKIRLKRKVKAKDDPVLIKRITHQIKEEENNHNNDQIHEIVNFKMDERGFLIPTDNTIIDPIASNILDPSHFELPKPVERPNHANKVACKHGIKSLVILNEHKIQIIDKNNEERIFCVRTYLYHVDPESSKSLRKYKKSDSCVIKIKKQKDPQCDCFKILKDFNKKSTVRMLKNNSIFLIDQKEIEAQFPRLYNLLTKN